MGKIDLNQLRAEAEKAKKAESYRGGEEGEKIKVKWAKAGKAYAFVLQNPWRPEGMPFFTIGSHVNLDGAEKFMKCINSVPHLYRPANWQPCPICERFQELGEKPEIWLSHSANVIMEGESEVSVLQIHSSVKNYIIFAMSEGEEICETKLIRAKKSGDKYQTLFCQLKDQVATGEPYDLDKVFEYYFSEHFYKKLIGASLLIQGKSPKAISQPPKKQPDFTKKPIEQEMKEAAEGSAFEEDTKEPNENLEVVNEAEPEPEKVEEPPKQEEVKAGKKSPPLCYGDHLRPTKGLTCKTCKVETACKQKTKEKNKGKFEIK